MCKLYALYAFLLTCHSFTSKQHACSNIGSSQSAGTAGVMVAQSSSDPTQLALVCCQTLLLLASLYCTGVVLVTEWCQSQSVDHRCGCKHTLAGYMFRKYISHSFAYPCPQVELCHLHSGRYEWPVGGQCAHHAFRVYGVPAAYQQQA